MCVCETKTDEYDTVDIDGYVYFSKHRSHPFERKSGGIGVYVRNNLSHHVQIIKSESEYVLWLVIHKSVTCYSEIIVLGIVYIPPDNSRFFKEDDFIIFENEVTELSNAYPFFMLTGDLNARMSNILDFIESDSFLDDLFHTNDGLTGISDKNTLLESMSFSQQRFSKDTRSNARGLTFIDLCKEHDLFVRNGRCGSDKEVGNFTFRDISVIDYVIASINCLDSLHTFDIYETDALYSDGHNALQWSLKLKRNVTTCMYTEQNEQRITDNMRPPWNNSQIPSFVSNIDESIISSIDLQLSTYPHSGSTIDNITYSLQNLFQKAAQSAFSATSRQTTNYPNSTNKPWFGSKCKRSRDNYHRAKSTYAKNKTYTKKVNLRNSSKQYKRTMNYYIKEYRYKSANQLRSMSTKSPKQYWRFLNGITQKK